MDPRPFDRWPWAADRPAPVAVVCGPWAWTVGLLLSCPSCCAALRLCAPALERGQGRSSSRTPGLARGGLDPDPDQAGKGRACAPGFWSQCKCRGLALRVQKTVVAVHPLPGQLSPSSAPPSRLEKAPLSMTLRKCRACSMISGCSLWYAAITRFVNSVIVRPLALAITRINS